MDEKRATRDELADGALDHYQRVSAEALEWNSLIPKAIEAWRKMPEMRTRIAALEEENERLREALEYIVERYESDDETGYVAASMYEAAKAALA